MAPRHYHHAQEIEGVRISLEEAKKLFDEGRAVFVDVRSPTSYRFSHIPGSINIPLRELPRRMGELPKDLPIVTI